MNKLTNKFRALWAAMSLWDCPVVSKCLQAVCGFLHEFWSMYTESHATCLQVVCGFQIGFGARVNQIDEIMTCSLQHQSKWWVVSICLHDVWHVCAVSYAGFGARTESPWQDVCGVLLRPTRILEHVLNHNATCLQVQTSSHIEMNRKWRILDRVVVPPP